MKKIILLLLTTFSLSAQVKGVVLDSISGKPVAYVGVFTSKPEFNFSTDKKGKFKAENLTKQDTLWFFTTGYEEKKITVENLDKKILLKPNANTQETENIDLYNQKKQWIDFQTNNNSHSASSYAATSLKAYFIEGISNQKNKLFLDNLSLSTLNFSEKSNIFKIRFFKTDSLKNIGEEYNIDPLIINVKSSDSDGVNNIIKNFIQTHDINILDRKIEIPENGFFIAIEVINIKKNRYTMDHNGTKVISISPSIKTTKLETKVYQYNKGKWKATDKMNNYPDFKISIATTQN
ncbi:carboxypeptidase-like regulatory domain-containing protein [uncultured Flavobacterium sp.]|uniref:carboxypeptidase-like regulatory domain-containing protein n=1 Tax=uncultured Flavobacterium sp. TaxID=165435 RepID=UPI0030EC6998|tara:strand:+ start:22070 stop:22945 length:876 start_codon:yes stop_codon:yes gene_type:complete